MSSERLVVAIDTSTDMLACAVARVTDAAGDGRMTIDVLATGDHMCRRRANVELVNTIDAALADAGRSRDEVDAYLVGRGPGSFTGVRIGISTAKGLARGANAPLYGASTLDACAWTAWRAGVRGLLGVAADAMRGEVYPALYQLDEAGAHRMFDREHVVKVAVAVEEWAAHPDAASLQLTGDGLKRYGSRFNEAGLTNRIDESLWHPTGEGLLLAWQAVEMGAVAGAGAVAAAGPAALHGARTSCDPALVLPIYTRLSDAEENERKRLGLVQSAQSEVTGVADELAGRHLQFRPMGAADAEAASVLEASCFAGAAHTPWTPTQFLSELGEGATVPRSWWVAHDNGELVGLAGGMVIELPWRPSAGVRASLESFWPM